MATRVQLSDLERRCCQNGVGNAEQDANFTMVATKHLRYRIAGRASLFKDTMQLKRDSRCAKIKAIGEMKRV